MFAIPAGIYVVVAILFLIFASGEVQNFDKKEYKKKYCFLIWGGITMNNSQLKFTDNMLLCFATLLTCLILYAYF